jgi:hypothetical protein
MVVDAEAEVQGAMRDGVPLAELVECRCRGCDATLFVTRADVVSFHGTKGDWPNGMECPACWRRREQAEWDRERAVLRAVARATRATMRMRDETDRQQVVLLAAVPELLDLDAGPLQRYYLGELTPRKLFAAAFRIAKHWGIGVDILLSAAAYRAAREAEGR